MGDIEEMVRILDVFCFTFRHVKCIYTLSKYPFSIKSVARSDEVFDNEQRVVCFNQRTNGMDRRTECPESLKRGSIEKSSKSFYQVFTRRQNPGKLKDQPSEKIEQVKETEHELELIKIVDCFLDTYGDYTSNLITFKMKTLKINCF